MSDMDFEKSINTETENEGADFDVEYNIKGDYKHPIIVMEAVRVAREKRSKEMNKGFWNTKLDKLGNPIKTWIPDERKEYIGAVKALQIIMSAELTLDKKYQEELKEQKKEIEKLFDEFAYESYQLVLGGGWVHTGRKYLPQLGEEVLIPQPGNRRNLIPAAGAWDGKTNAYYNLVVEIYDKIFEELCKVICRKNYYDEVASF